MFKRVEELKAGVSEGDILSGTTNGHKTRSFCINTISSEPF